MAPDPKPKKTASGKSAASSKAPKKLRPLKKTPSAKRTANASLLNAAAPVRKSRPKKRTRPHNDKPTANDLPSPVKSKDIQIRIADAVNDVLQRRRRFEITNRGRTVAILAPVGDLPKGMRINETITTTDIAKGKRNFGNVAAHGPYMVRRGQDNVAVLYSPGADLGQKIDFVLARMEELDLIEAGIEKRKRIRQTADDMIRQRIALLRKAGDDAAADRIEEAFKSL